MDNDDFVGSLPLVVVVGGAMRPTTATTTAVDDLCHDRDAEDRAAKEADHHRVCGSATNAGGDEGRALLKFHPWDPRSWRAPHAPRAAPTHTITRTGGGKQVSSSSKRERLLLHINQYTNTPLQPTAAAVIPTLAALRGGTSDHIASQPFPSASSLRELAQQLKPTSPSAVTEPSTMHFEPEAAVASALCWVPPCLGRRKRGTKHILVEETREDAALAFLAALVARAGSAATQGQEKGALFTELDESIARLFERWLRAKVIAFSNSASSPDRHTLVAFIWRRIVLPQHGNLHDTRLRLCSMTLLASIPSLLDISEPALTASIAGILTARMKDQDMRVRLQALLALLAFLQHDCPRAPGCSPTFETKWEKENDASQSRSTAHRLRKHRMLGRLLSLPIWHALTHLLVHDRYGRVRETAAQCVAAFVPIHDGYGLPKEALCEKSFLASRVQDGDGTPLPFRRLSNEAFLVLCGLATDISVRVRTAGFKAMVALKDVDPVHLMQTLDKKIMSHLRVRKSAHQYLQEKHGTTNSATVQGILSAAALRGNSNSNSSSSSNDDNDGSIGTSDGIDEELMTSMRKNATAHANASQAKAKAKHGNQKPLVANVSILSAGSCGAFVHGLEDEMDIVRIATLEALCAHSEQFGPFALKSLNFLVDMFNDDIPEVRLKTLATMISLSKHYTLREEQLDMMLGILEDTVASVRLLAHQLLGQCLIGNHICLHVVLHKLFEGLKKYPSDSPSVFRAMHNLGRAHPPFAMFLAQRLLAQDPNVISPQPEVTDPIYACVVIFLTSSAAVCPSLRATLPRNLDQQRRALALVHGQMPSINSPHPNPTISALFGVDQKPQSRKRFANQQHFSLQFAQLGSRASAPTATAQANVQNTSNSVTASAKAVANMKHPPTSMRPEQENEEEDGDEGDMLTEPLCEERNPRKRAKRMPHSTDTDTGNMSHPINQGEQPSGLHQERGSHDHDAPPASATFTQPSAVGLLSQAQCFNPTKETRVLSHISGFATVASVQFQFQGHLTWRNIVLKVALSQVAKEGGASPACFFYWPHEEDFLVEDSGDSTAAPAARFAANHADEDEANLLTIEAAVGAIDLLLDTQVPIPADNGNATLVTITPCIVRRMSSIVHDQANQQSSRVSDEPPTVEGGDDAQSFREATIGGNRYLLRAAPASQAAHFKLAPKDCELARV